MSLLHTLVDLGDRLQIALVVGSVPTDGSGDVSVVYANDRAANIFGYGAGEDVVGQDVRSLMTPDVARVHQGHVGGYLSRSKSKNGAAFAAKQQGRIMGSWRNLKGVRLDGSLIDLQANVADIKSQEDRYFIAVFRDRTEEVQRERDLREALEQACKAKAEAEASMQEAETARAEAETYLRRQDDLSNQVSLLLNNMTTFRSHAKPDEVTFRVFARHHWYSLTGLAAASMTALVITGMFFDTPVSLVERVLLVLCGVLGTSLASVLMPHRGE